MATTIVKVEKKYPSFIFTTATGRHYTATVDNRGVTFRNTINNVVNRPTALRDFDNLFSLFDYPMGVGNREYLIKIADSITSLPDCDFSQCPNSDAIRRFAYTWGELPVKKVIKWYAQFGQRIFSSDVTFFATNVLAVEEKWTEEEIRNFPHRMYDSDSKRRYALDKKFRSLYIKALSNPAARYIDADRVGKLVAQLIEDCKDLEMSIPTGDFWRNVTYVHQTHEQKKHEFEEKHFIKAQTQRNLFFEDDTFIVHIPMSYRECAEEGAAMHNCIGGYEWEEFLSKGKRCVVFIRRKSAPDIPYVDWDMLADTLETCQVYGARNQRCSDADFHDFKIKYLNYLSSIV